MVQDACVNNSDNTSLANLTNNIPTLCLAARTNGWLTLVCTPFSNQSETNSPYVRTNWINWVKANYTNFADGIVDSSADTNYGVMGCYTNTAWFANTIHANPQAYTNWINNYLTPAVKAVLAK